MAKRIAKTVLNASSIDILNVIRGNASQAYRDAIPVITDVKEIPVVGERLYGAPALLNEFINALMTRIAFVKLESGMFNNPYVELKKGKFDFGETIEHVFVGMIEAFSYVKAQNGNMEHKTYDSNIKSVFYAINWRVVYPITIKRQDVRTAFTSESGVTDMLERQIQAVFTTSNYHEFCLFKYLLVKKITAGLVKCVALPANATPANILESLKEVSGLFKYPEVEYNEAGVENSCPVDRQVVFLDEATNAKIDVNALAVMFNVDRAMIPAKVYTVDHFDKFNNGIFATIRGGDGDSDNQIEVVTDAELALMQSVKAVICDKEFFQVYDNLNEMTESETASELKRNYFYHNWKVVTTSPFANIVALVDSGATIATPASVTVTVKSKDQDDNAIVITLDDSAASATLVPHVVKYVQTGDLTEDGIAVDYYGAITIPIAKSATELTLKATIGGVGYTASSAITGASVDVGDTVTLAKDV